MLCLLILLTLYAQGVDSTTGCPKGWMQHRHLCFYTSTYKDTWENAKQACRNADSRADLASFHNEQEHSLLTTKMFWDLWIGLNNFDNKDVWVWTDGTDTSNLLWDKDEPNKLEEERCGEVVIRVVDEEKDRGTLNNLACSIKLNFACMMRTGTCLEGWMKRFGACYYISDHKDTWENSRKFCRNLHPSSDLMSVHSQEEIDFLLERMHWRAWMGLRLSGGQWTWTDQSPVDYVHWKEGEPNLLEYEHCGEIFHDNSWNNAKCHHKKQFFCKIDLQPPVTTGKKCPPITPDPTFTSKCFTPYPEQQVPCDQPVNTGVRAIHQCTDVLYAPTEESSNRQQCTNDGTWSGNFKCTPECGVPSSISGQTNFIVGGKPASSGQWPWHAAMYEKKRGDWSYFCGGSLISNTVILTAAHCAVKGRGVEPRPSQDVMVGLGKHFREYNADGSSAQLIQVERIVVYEYYNPTSFDSDIAILILKQPAQITPGVRPVCFPLGRGTSQEEQALKPDSIGVLVGWGKTESGELANELQMAQLPYVHPQECLNSLEGVHKTYVRESNFCVGYKNGTRTNSCTGDSGSGMVFPVGSGSKKRYYLYGITSFGLKKSLYDPCDPTMFTFFTRVSVFSHWIVRMISNIN